MEADNNNLTMVIFGDIQNNTILNYTSSVEVYDIANTILSGLTALIFSLSIFLNIFLFIMPGFVIPCRKFTCSIGLLIRSLALINALVAFFNLLEIFSIALPFELAYIFKTPPPTVDNCWQFTLEIFMSWSMLVSGLSNAFLEVVAYTIVMSTETNPSIGENVIASYLVITWIMPSVFWFSYFGFTRSVVKAEEQVPATTKCSLYLLYFSEDSKPRVFHGGILLLIILILVVLNIRMRNKVQERWSYGVLQKSTAAEVSRQRILGTSGRILLIFACCWGPWLLYFILVCENCAVQMHWLLNWIPLQIIQIIVAMNRLLLALKTLLDCYVYYTRIKQSQEDFQEMLKFCWTCCPRNPIEELQSHRDLERRRRNIGHMMAGTTSNSNTETGDMELTNLEFKGNQRVFSSRRRRLVEVRAQIHSGFGKKLDLNRQINPQQNGIIPIWKSVDNVIEMVDRRREGANSMTTSWSFPGSRLNWNGEMKHIGDGAIGSQQCSSHRTIQGRVQSESGGSNDHIEIKPEVLIPISKSANYILEAGGGKNMADLTQPTYHSLPDLDLKNIGLQRLQMASGNFHDRRIAEQEIARGQVLDEFDCTHGQKVCKSDEVIPRTFDKRRGTTSLARSLSVNDSWPNDTTYDSSRINEDTNPCFHESFGDLKKLFEIRGLKFIPEVRCCECGSPVCTWV